MSGSASSQNRWTFTSFDKSSKGSRSHDSVEKLESPYCGSLPYECNPIVPGPMARHAAWPPLVLHVESLGFIVDESGRSYSRDVGQSSSIGKDGVIFQFGNTFVQNDVKEYYGDISNSLALVPQPHIRPTVTSYALNGEGVVPSLIPLRSEERNEDLYGRKTTLRSSGGVVETGGTDGEVVAGWIFYQKGTERYPDGGEHVIHYTGVAKLFLDLAEKKLSVMRICNPLELFKSNEPSFGTFSTVKQDKIAYLFGHAPGSTKIMLARVNVTWVLDRSRYHYWDGNKYQGDITKAKHVMDDVEHGAIYRSKLFEPQKGRDWIFIGCSRFGDGKVLLGVSANLEGPYSKFELMDTFSINPTIEESSRYCIYPHPWAFKEEDGELMITWSEGSTTGGVVAVRVKFVMTMDKGRQTTTMERSIKRGKGRCVIL